MQNELEIFKNSSQNLKKIFKPLIFKTIHKTSSKTKLPIQKKIHQKIFFNSLKIFKNP
jgi:hypothetical protein